MKPYIVVELGGLEEFTLAIQAILGQSTSKVIVHSPRGNFEVLINWLMRMVRNTRQVGEERREPSIQERDREL